MRLSKEINLDSVLSVCGQLVKNVQDNKMNKLRPHKRPLKPDRWI